LLTLGAASVVSNPPVLCADLFVLVAPVKGWSQLAFIALHRRSVLCLVAGASVYEGDRVYFGWLFLVWRAEKRRREMFCVHKRRLVGWLVHLLGVPRDRDREEQYVRWRHNLDFWIGLGFSSRVTQSKQISKLLHCAFKLRSRLIWWKELP